MNESRMGPHTYYLSTTYTSVCVEANSYTPTHRIARAREFDRPELDADRVAHRPTERDQLAREARRLATQGLTARDIGAALALSEAAVRDLLRGPADAR